MNGSNIPGLENSEPESGVVDNVESNTAGPQDSAPANDLERILAELAQYSSAQQQTRRPEPAPEDFRHTVQLQYLQLQENHRQEIHHVPAAQNATHQRILDPRLNRSTLTPPAQLFKTPLIDPATILEWTQALRCVNKIAAQNPNLAPAVKGVSQACLD
jgi:hypothetical protein